MALTAAQLLRFELNYKRIKVVGGSKRLAIVANGREKARTDAEVEENNVKKWKKVPNPLFLHEKWYWRCACAAAPHLACFLEGG